MGEELVRARSCGHASRTGGAATRVNRTAASDRAAGVTGEDAADGGAGGCRHQLRELADRDVEECLRHGRCGLEKGGLEITAEIGTRKLEPPVRIEAVQPRGGVVRQPGLQQDQEVAQGVAPEELVAG